MQNNHNISHGDLLRRQFGRHLAQLRRDRGITQEDMATLLGVSVQQVSRIERGVHGPRFDLLADIAHTLGVEPQELFEFRASR